MVVEWIDKIIIGLSEIYNTSCPYELCEMLNIKLVKINSNKSVLLGNESTYIRNYLGDEIIFIRNDLNHIYEKFIIAHELGHAILHVEIQAASFNKKLINKGKLEKQANYFAFKLLDIQIDPIELEGYTIDQISSILHLPLKSLKQLIN